MLETILPHTFTQAAGWAVLHSLWQLALLWILSWAVLRLLRPYAPAIRYQVAVGMECAALAIMLWTVYGAWERPLVQPSLLRPAEARVSSKEPTLSPESQAIPLKSPFSIWHNRLEPVVPWMARGWMFGVLILMLRLFWQRGRLYCLRRFGSRQLRDRWEVVLRRLKQQLGIKKPIQLRQSEYCSGPLTFGYLRPVILFPVGLVNCLTSRQVEAVLLHELAHIYRRDYLVNLLLSCVEVFLFYHPAIWWLGREVRRLREEACDELVLQQGHDPVDYAGSLLQLQKIISTTKINIAMKAETHLSRRIRRLFQQTTSPRHWSRPLTAGLLSLSIIIGLAFSSRWFQGDPTVSVAAEKMNLFYTGVDNPVTIAVAGIPGDKLKVTSEEVEILPRGEGQYLVRADQPGDARLLITAPGLDPVEKVFRVERLPDPVALLEFVGKTPDDIFIDPESIKSIYSKLAAGGSMPADAFKRFSGLDLRLPMDFDAGCRLQSFQVVRVPHRAGPIPEEWSAESPDSMQKVRALIQQAHPGDFYYFDKIKVRCEGDSDSRQVNGVVIRIE